MFSRSKSKTTKSADFDTCINENASTVLLHLLAFLIHWTRSFLLVLRTITNRILRPVAMPRSCGVVSRRLPTRCTVRYHLPRQDLSFHSSCGTPSEAVAVENQLSNSNMRRSSQDWLYLNALVCHGIATSTHVGAFPAFGQTFRVAWLRFQARYNRQGDFQGRNA